MLLAALEAQPADVPPALYCLPHMRMWTKLRPGVREFLEAAKQRCARASAAGTHTSWIVGLLLLLLLLTCTAPQPAHMQLLPSNSQLPPPPHTCMRPPMHTQV